MPTDQDRPPVLCVIGSYARALVLTAPRIPITGETLLGRDYRETHGGKGADMAVQAARLGAQVRFLGAIGDDVHGRACQSLMAEEGVDASQLFVLPGVPTGVGFIIKDDAGENIIVVDPGANEQFDSARLEACEPALVEATVALTQLEIPLQTALAGLAMAHQAGATTILNPAPAVYLADTDLSCVSVITPNQTEARVILGLAPDDPTPDRMIAEQLLTRGVQAVCITLGGAGAMLYQVIDGEPLETRIAPYEVEVVDSNGAGDSFNAGLAVALMENMPLPTAARFAAATAAIACTEWETIPSYPDRAAVERLRAAQKGTP